MKNIKITISNEKMEARITIQDRGDKFPSEEKIYQTLRDAGVKFGIDNNLIDKIILERNPVSDLLVALGKPPVKGKNAKLMWYIDLNTNLKPAITEDGKADFKRLNQYVSIESNHEIVSKLPLTDGDPGYDVENEPLIMPGKDIDLPAGDNTYISDDGLTLYSKIKGFAFWKSSKVYIDNVYHIKGDVDFSTGNVVFNGMVIIDGDVRSGFRVNATDSIYIEGNVEAANIYSEKGNIFIQLGILGKGRAKVLAGGSLYCGYVQDATLGAGKNIVIDHYVINSAITCGGRVICKDNEGLIRGGKVFADQGVIAVEIGTEQRISTEIGISGGDLTNIIGKRLDINKKAEILKLRYSTLQKQIEFYLILEDRLNGLSDDKQKTLKKLIGEYKNLEVKIKSLELHTKTLVQDNDMNDEPKSIIIWNKLHKGVTITFGHYQHFTDSMYKGIKIYCRDGGILFEEISGILGEA